MLADLHLQDVENNFFLLGVLVLFDLRGTFEEVGNLVVLRDGELAIAQDDVDNNEDGIVHCEDELASDQVVACGLERDVGRQVSQYRVLDRA